VEKEKLQDVDEDVTVDGVDKEGGGKEEKPKVELIED
jgi:hypothetical protein